MRRLVAALIALLTAFFIGNGEAWADAVTIGAVLPLTGKTSSVGEAQSKTLVLLADEINARGGLRGRKIELVILDSRGDAVRAADCARTLVARRAAAVIGPSAPAEALAVMKVCEENRTPLISLGGRLPGPVRKYAFAVPGPFEPFVDVLAAALKKRSLTAVALLTDARFGAGQEEFLETAFAANGIAVAVRERYSRLDSDFTSLAARLKGKKFDALVNWADGPAQGTLTRDLRRAGLVQPLFQSPAFGDELYVQAAGTAAEGVFFPQDPVITGRVGTQDKPRLEALERYRASYEKRYGAPPPYVGWPAADAFAILVRAFADGGTDAGSVRRGIEGVRGLAGVNGVYNYGPTDHNGTASQVELLTVRNGRFEPANRPVIMKGRFDAGDDYKPVVAVMDFTRENLPPGDGDLIQEVLSSSLVRSKRYYVVEKKERQALLRTLQDSLSDLSDQASQVRVGKWLGAKKVFTGSLGKVEGKILVTVKLIDLESSVTEASQTKMFASIEEILNQSDALIEALGE